MDDSTGSELSGVAMSDGSSTILGDQRGQNGRRRREEIAGIVCGALAVQKEGDMR